MNYVKYRKYQVGDSVCVDTDYMGLRGQTGMVLDTEMFNNTIFSHTMQGWPQGL